LKIFFTSTLLLLSLVFRFNAWACDYYGALNLTDQYSLPLQIKIQNSDFFLINGLEIIPLQKRLVPNTDSLDLVFPNFNSYLRCKFHKKKMLGYWQNLQKDNYRIPFSVIKKKQKSTKTENQVSGKWSAMFSTQNNPYPAVGIFESNGTQVYGTFLTETGDYRYLSGFVKNDSLFLATFNGSQAFLFVAAIHGDSLNGSFFSGKHYKTDWVAHKNENATLQNPYTLTKHDEQQKVRFTFPDVKGNFYSFPNHITENKVTVIMLMGTWCPNCIDEAHFFKQVREKYGKDKLEIIAVCYEVSDVEEKRREAVQKMINQNQFDFTFLVAGKANKTLAHQHFPMLNHVMSFPTTLYLDKNGDVRKIYTGFYGPATGVYYENYAKETFELLEVLIGE
jgi:thiol-disulfide isomerase/thioredoxin